MEIVKLFLNDYRGEKLVNIKNKDGEDAFEFALSENQTDAYEYLCKKFNRP